MLRAYNKPPDRAMGLLLSANTGQGYPLYYHTSMNAIAQPLTHGFTRAHTPPTLFAHQAKSVAFYAERPEVFDQSDAGTGKTLVNIEVIRKDTNGRTLVVCPKSIMQPAWGDDLTKFAPEIPYSIADARNRERAFKADTQVVILNHDGVEYLRKNPKFLEGFTRIINDESTYIKNPQSLRSRHVADLRDQFTHCVNLSATPTPQGILDLWHQMYVLDKGQRLGNSFYRFRASVCEPKNSFGFIRWDEKEGVADAVASLISDIVIRHKLEDCLDIPPNRTIDLSFDLPAQLRRQYNELKRKALLELKEGTVSALNAASLLTKLLQLSSGGVYDENGTAQILDHGRYELVVDLVEQYMPCVVAFNWRHQRDELCRLAKQRGLRFGVIDGSVVGDTRTMVVRDFQEDKLDVVFANVSSCSHGLTLTRGKATIWSSPTYNSEHYVQFNHRVYRATQTKETTTIRISARDTVDMDAYESLGNKVTKMIDLLGMME